jgi:ABC-type phosphate/phosphonate transport system permease subunit
MAVASELEYVVDAAADAEAPPPRRPRVRWFALRRDIPSAGYTALTVASFVVMFLLWVWASHQQFVNPIFMPAPERVWEAARTFLTEGDLWTDVKVSFVRVTLGVILSIGLAVPLGVLIGSFQVGQGLLQPLTEFIRYIPVPALIPLMMVLFGIGELPKIMFRRSSARSVRAPASRLHARRNPPRGDPTHHLACGLAGDLRRAPLVQRLGVDLSRRRRARRRQ